MDPFDDITVPTPETVPNAAEGFNTFQTSSLPPPADPNAVRQRMAAQKAQEGQQQQVMQELEQASAPAEVLDRFDPAPDMKRTAKRAKALQDTPEQISTLQNFVNAGIKTFKNMTKGNIYYHLLERDPEAAERYAQANEALHPTYDGISETVGEVAGSLIPTVAALAASIFPEPVTTAAGLAMLGTYGASAMGGGLAEAARYEDESGDELTVLQEAAVASGYAAAELIAERLRLKWLIKVSPKQAAALGDALKNVSDFVPTLATMIGTNMLQEAAEESLTEIAQNVADLIYKPLDQWQGPFEGVPQAAFAGAIGGGMLAGAQIPVGAIRNAQQGSQRNAAREATGREIDRRLASGERVDAALISVYTGFEAKDVGDNVSLVMPNGESKVLIKQGMDIQVTEQSREAFFDSITAQIESGNDETGGLVEVGGQVIEIPKTYEAFLALDEESQVAIFAQYEAAGVTLNGVDIEVDGEVIPFDAAVSLSKTANATTFNHEVWHVIKKMGLLDERDIATLEANFVDEEAEAAAFEEYTYNSGNSMFDDIVDFFRGIVRVGGRSAEQIQKEASQGKGLVGQGITSTGGDEQKFQARRINFRPEDEGSYDPQDHADNLYEILWYGIMEGQNFKDTKDVFTFLTDNAKRSMDDWAYGLDTTNPDDRQQLLRDVREREATLRLANDPEVLEIILKLQRDAGEQDAEFVDQIEVIDSQRLIAKLDQAIAEESKRTSFDIESPRTDSPDLGVTNEPIPPRGTPPLNLDDLSFSDGKAVIDSALDDYQNGKISKERLQSIIDEHTDLYQARRVTPAQDAAYMRAAESGDTKTAQGLVDEAAKAAGYTIETWRGDREAYNNFSGRRESGVFTSQDKDFADQYGGMSRGVTRRFYVKSDKVLNLNDYRSRDWITNWASGFDQEDWYDRKTGETADPVEAIESGQLFDWEGDWSGRMWRDLQDSARQDGYSVLIAPDSASAIEDPQSTIVLDPGAIKSADPITKDDQGNIIPLSERFNEQSDDIRFQAKRVTPAQDKAYMAAVDSGDVKAQQEMVDAAAKASMPKSLVRPNAASKSWMPHKHDPNLPLIKLYHGGEKGSTTFSKMLDRPDSGYAQGNLNSQGVWLTASRGVEGETSEFFASSDASTYASNYADGGQIYDVYVNITNPKQIGHDEAASTTAEDILSEGFDGVYFIDTGFWVALDPSQIKSADPITRDDQGNIIPLSERFNEQSDDIRFQAKRVTPAQDKAYMAAVDSGDVKAQQEMVDAAAKAGSITPLRGIHRTDKDFRQFGPDFKKDKDQLAGIRKSLKDAFGIDIANLSELNQVQKYAEFLKGDELISPYSTYGSNKIDAKFSDWQALMDAVESARPLVSSMVQVERSLSKNSAGLGRHASGLGLTKDELLASESTPLQFNTKASGKNDSGWLGTGAYFSAGDEGSVGLGDHKIDAYLYLKKPYIMGESADVGVDPKANPEGFRKALEDAGYDGVIARGKHSTMLTDEYVAFDPNQIKSADPITRDDQGNVIPLSERFNEQSDDIRFQAKRKLLWSDDGSRESLFGPKEDEAFTLPDHLYRSMSEGEYQSAISSGSIRSDNRDSFLSEGTNFSDNWQTARSYAYVKGGKNTDPAITGNPDPHYIVEIPKGEIKQARDGYFKTPDAVPMDTSTRVWKIYGEGKSVYVEEVQASGQQFQAQRKGKRNQVPPGTRPDTRAFHESVMEKYFPGHVPNKQTHADAAKLLDTPEKFEAEMENVRVNGYNANEPVQVAKAMQITARAEEMSFDADPQDLDFRSRMYDVIDQYARGGTNQGRGLQIRSAPVTTPREALIKMILEPHKELRKQRRQTKAGSPAQKRVDKKIFAEQDRIRAKLKKKGLDPSQLDASDTAGQRKSTQMVAAMRTDKGDKLYEYWVSMGLLSGLATQGANLSGNSLSGAWEFMVQLPVEILLNKAAFKNTRHIQELPAASRGFMRGFQPAIRNMIQSFREERSVYEEDFLGVKSHSKHHIKGAIAGQKGKAIRVPLRMLQAADDFYKTIYGYMGAYQSATMMGLNENLSKKQLEDFVAEQLGDVQSAAWLFGHEKSLYLSFQNDAGPLVKNINNIRSEVPGPRWIMPFTTVVGNILKMGFAKSPLGSVPLIARVGKAGLIKALPNATLKNSGDADIIARGQQIERGAAEQVIAWVFTMGLAEFLWGDDDEENELPKLTGSIAPGSERWRQMWMEGVIQPNSILVGDKYYSYIRIEPIGTALGLIVDGLVAAKAAKDGKEFDEAMGQAYREMAQVALDKTFLYGISDLMESMRSDKGILQWVQNFAVSFSPNIVRSSLRASDAKIPNYKITEKPYIEGVVDNMLHRAAPLPSWGPPKKTTIWGEDVEKPAMGGPLSTFLWQLASPVKVMDVSTRRGVDMMIYRINEKAQRGDRNSRGNAFKPLAFQPPGFEISVNKTRYRYTREQYHTYLSRRGQIAEQMLSGRFSPDQVENPGEREKQAIKSAFDKAGSRARNEIKSEVLQNGPA